jgi:ferredoxin
MHGVLDNSGLMDESERIDHIIIPRSEAREIVSRVDNIYLRDCPCRKRQRACPPDEWEVCLLFDAASQDDLCDARPITPDEALALLRVTAERGTINQLFYTHEGRRVTEICNCCTCCCFPLRELEQKGNYGEWLRTDYVAVTDAEQCAVCGLCEESCFFGARLVIDRELHFAAERCFGCGRCIPDCPEGVIALHLQAGRGVPIPTAV